MVISMRLEVFRYISQAVGSSKVDYCSVSVICFLHEYRNFPKYSDTQKIWCNLSKIWTMWLYHRVMSPNDADGMVNSVEAVWSGSALFAQAYLSENLGSSQ